MGGTGHETAKRLGLGGGTRGREPAKRLGRDCPHLIVDVSDGAVVGMAGQPLHRVTQRFGVRGRAARRRLHVGVPINFNGPAGYEDWEPVPQRLLYYS